MYFKIEGLTDKCTRIKKMLWKTSDVKIPELKGLDFTSKNDEKYFKHQTFSCCCFSAFVATLNVANVARSNTFFFVLLSFICFALGFIGIDAHHLTL